MRKALKNHQGRRATYTATFRRYGSFQPYKGPPVRTLLLVDIRNARDQVVADHLWFKDCLAWRRCGNLEPGQLLSFTAQVKEYRKGYRGRREEEDLPEPTTDLKLAWPMDVRLVDHKEENQLALF